MSEVNSPIQSPRESSFNLVRKGPWPMGQWVTLPTEKIRLINNEGFNLKEIDGTLTPFPDHAYGLFTPDDSSMPDLEIMPSSHQIEPSPSDIMYARMEMALYEYDNRISKGKIVEKHPHFLLDKINVKLFDNSSRQHLGEFLIPFIDRLDMCALALKRMHDFNLVIDPVQPLSPQVDNLPEQLVIDALCVYMRPFIMSDERVYFYKMLNHPALQNCPNFREWSKNQRNRWRSSCFYGLVDISYQGTQVTSETVVDAFFNSHLFHCSDVSNAGRSMNALMDMMGSIVGAYSILGSCLVQQYKVICETLNDIMSAFRLAVMTENNGIIYSPDCPFGIKLSDGERSYCSLETSMTIEARIFSTENDQGELFN